MLKQDSAMRAFDSGSSRQHGINTTGNFRMQVIIGRFRFEFENWTQPGSFARAWFIGTTRRDIWIEYRPWGDREPTANDKAWEIVRSGRTTNLYLGRLTVTVDMVSNRRAGMPIADSSGVTGEPEVISAPTH